MANLFQKTGRTGWQYHRDTCAISVTRSVNVTTPETQMGRWKGVIGPKLKARSFENQKTEVRIGVNVLNKMTELGRPKIEAVM